MRILITGGAGFIGSHLAEYHLGKGDSVTVVDDLSSGSTDVFAGFKNGKLRFEQADLLSWKNLKNEVKSAARVYHMAAVVGIIRVIREPIEVTRVNVLGTEHLLECVSRTKQLPEVVIASSSSVYGHSRSEALGEESELIYRPEQGGLTGYAISKLTNEIQASAYRHIHGLPVTIPRLFNAVGPRQSGTYGFVLPRFIEQALSGKPLTVYGDGTQTRSFCDVRDTVRAIDKLASNPKAWGKPVNVGNPREITILDLANLVIDRSGSSSPIEFVPFEKGYGSRFRQTTQRRPSVERLRMLADFRHSWSLEQTIDDLIRRNRKSGVPNGRLL